MTATLPLSHSLALKSMPSPANTLVIDLAAVKENLAIIKRRLPRSTRIMGMVKASAYGTNPLILSKFYQEAGIDILGVANVEEGRKLRLSGITTSIFVIHARVEEMELCLDLNLELAISYEEEALFLNNIAQKKERVAPVHLHIDTGMGRFGTRTENALPLAKKIASLPHLFLEGVMTHFACADDPTQDPFSKQQIALFRREVEKLKQSALLPKWVHAANTPATFRFSLPFCNMVRLGAAPLGLGCPKELKAPLGIRNVFTLKTKLVGLNTLKKGESVSYGRLYTVKQQEEVIGVLPLGYYDGIHRSLGGKGYVLINGQKAPLIGTICMDFMMVNLTHIPSAQRGDTATVFSNTLLVQTVAKWANTHVNEFVSCLGPRIERLFAP